VAGYYSATQQHQRRRSTGRLSHRRLHDRVSSADAMLLQEEIDFNPDQEVKVEIELVFTDDGDVGAQRKEALEALVVAEGGEVISACRYEEIEYDAVLAKLPPIAAQRIARRADDGLAGSVETFLIRPQSDIRVPLEMEEEGEALDLHRSVPDRPAIAAILDAVPIQNHPAFFEHIEYDDPDNLEELAIGERVHGTAITSLIVRGDLQSNEAPIRRKVHVRPLLFARADALKKDEIFDPDRLIVDDFVRAVRRMKEGEGEAPTASEILFINVSLGDLKRPFSGRLSAWARAIDWLAQKYGILFFVSAGNAERICVSEFNDERDFKDL